MGVIVITQKLNLYVVVALKCYIYVIEILSYSIGSCVLEVWLDLVYNVAHELTVDMDHFKKM